MKSKFRLEKTEKHAIKEACHCSSSIWEHNTLIHFKKRLKEHLIEEQMFECCYCRKLIKGEFMMVLDIEHVLPKANPRFKRYMFNTLNLAVSCKRCNMNIKGTRTDFIDTSIPFDRNAFNSDVYLIIHPRLDNYYDHIKRFCVTINGVSLVKYIVVPGSAKGEFTHTFFRLNELEIDSFDQAQGLHLHTEISASISPKLANKIANLCAMPF